MRNNIAGRVVGGILIALSLGWILQLAGAFDWRNTRTANQLIPDQPPVSDPAAFAAGAPRGTSGGNAQGFNVSQQPQSRPDDSTTTQPSGAQIPDGTTGTAGTPTGTTSTDGPAVAQTGGTAGSTTTGSTPVVRAGW